MLTRAELDLAGCEECDEPRSELTFSAACHPEAHVDVVYRSTSGSIVLVCTRCGQQAAEIKVADT